MARIKRIDHVAIAVRDCDKARAQYENLLGAEHVRTEVLREKAGVVKVVYLRIGENVLSLVQSLEADGFINRHIERHGEGLHHLGLEVDDLAGFVKDAEAKGYAIPLRDEFSNRSEVVLRPRDAAGVVLQVLQWTDGAADTVEARIERIWALKNREPE
jgi:methylmalonyl-CoA/ethylmalonyl-CoA epimerase